MHAAQAERAQLVAREALVAPTARVDQRIAGTRVSQAQHDADLAGVQCRDIHVLVRVREQQPRDALLGMRCGVDRGRARLQRTRVHPHKGDGAALFVPHHLEGQCRRVGVTERDRCRPLLRRIRRDAPVDLGAVCGAGQVQRNRVKEWLHADVAGRCTAQHRRNVASERQPAQCLLDGADRQRRGADVVELEQQLKQLDIQ